jgi:hypothetical protein
MFDQVVNHVGYGDFSDYHPFNATTDFHNCDGRHAIFTCSSAPCVVSWMVLSVSFVVCQRVLSAVLSPAQPVSCRKRAGKHVSTYVLQQTVHLSPSTPP